MTCLDVYAVHNSWVDLHDMLETLTAEVGFHKLSQSGREWKEMFYTYTDVHPDDHEDYESGTLLWRCLATMLRKRLSGVAWNSRADRLLKWLSMVCDHGGSILFINF